MTESAVRVPVTRHGRALAISEQVYGGPGARDAASGKRLLYSKRLPPQKQPEKQPKNHYLVRISITSDSATKTPAAIFVPRASLASKVFALDLLK